MFNDEMNSIIKAYQFMEYYNLDWYECLSLLASNYKCIISNNKFSGYNMFL